MPKKINAELRARAVRMVALTVRCERCPELRHRGAHHKDQVSGLMRWQKVRNRPSESSKLTRCGSVIGGDSSHASPRGLIEDHLVLALQALTGSTAS